MRGHAMRMAVQNLVIGGSMATMLSACGLLGIGDPDEIEGLRKIAVLPVAYSDGAGGGYPCDICPGTIQLKPTTAQAARLATGFLYEEVARHPRILKPGFELVEPAAKKGMRQGAAELAAAGQADAVLATALVELRPRVGSDHGPDTPAGAVMYAALVDARTGAVLWSSTFDGNESGPGVVRKRINRLTGAKVARWRTAEGYTEAATRELVEGLMDHLDG